MIHIPGPDPNFLRSDIDAFLTELQAIGRSNHTVRAYGWHLYRFALWAEDLGVRKVDEIPQVPFLEWMSSLWETYQPATIKQAAQALRAWLRWLHRKQILEKNLAPQIPVPRVGFTPQRTLTSEEIRRLFKVCNPNAPVGARNLALMAVLLETGLREGELVRLRLGDWNQKRGCFEVLGKGRRRDIVWCSTECVAYIQNWLRFRGQAARSGVAHLFVSLGGITPGRLVITHKS